MRPVAGVVLAAGESTRMGRNKLLLGLEGETLLHRAVRPAIEAGLAPTIVVLGADADRMSGELAGLGCSIVVNPEPERGQTSSLQAGLAALPGATDAAVVMLADMPLVTSAMISALVAAYRDSESALVVSDYGGVFAPPLLYSRSLFAEINAMHGDGCGKRIIKAHLHEALVVAQPADALVDLDTPADYQQAVSRPAAR